MNDQNAVMPLHSLTVPSVHAAMLRIRLVKNSHGVFSEKDSLWMLVNASLLKIDYRPLSHQMQKAHACVGVEGRHYRLLTRAVVRLLTCRVYLAYMASRPLEVST